jgi:signal transduction histidine kinase/CheY-like chemotaxis protein
VARRLAVGLEGCRHRLAPEAGVERLQRLLHDVRTPLTAVRGFAELLAARDFPAERRRELLGMLHAEALRLTEALDRASQAAPGEEGYQAAERLRLASRLEAVGQLAGGIAHDFNNLLTAISGYSELLLGRLGPGEPMRAELVEIHRAGERAADLTRQLLAFSRIQVLEPRRLDLNVEVREAASMLRRLIGEAIELVLDLDPALGTVEADPGQLHQVILNLAVNARDAMPGGGTLTLATDEVAFDRPDRSHPEVAMPAGRWVRLLVTDTGTGMDEQTRARIFEPFFTTKEAGKGTGLGLSTVYGIVKQSGGYIWASSEPGAGTSFEIYLPWVAGEADAPVERDAAPAAAEPVAASVLVAEDNPAVRALIREILGSGGYTVHEAGDGAAALAVVAGGEPLDLVISDVVMPDLHGPELERRAAVLRPALRVRFISGSTGETLARPGAPAPGAPFLEKPFGAAKLLAKVREVLAGPAPEP